MSAGGAWAATATVWSEADPTNPPGVKELIEGGTVTDITITGTITADSAADFTNAAAAITITGGTLTGGTGDFFKVPTGKSLTLSGIALNLNIGSINADGGTINITGGTVSGAVANSIKAANGGTVTITGATTTLTSNTGVISLSDAASRIAFSAGTLNANFAGSLTVSNGTLEISGGTAVHTNQTRAISVTGGTFTIDGGTVTATNGPGIEITNGTATIKGATLSGNAVNTSGQGTTFENVSISGNGTADAPITVVTTSGTTTFTGGTIQNNYGSVTAPTINASGTITFNSTNFTSNHGTALLSAANATFNNVNFNGNSDITGANSGTVNINGGTVFVNASKFGVTTANTADPLIYIQSGSVFFDEPTQTGANFSTFTKNTGKSVQIEGGTHHFYKTKFTSNPSAAVALISGGTTNLHSVIVSDNNGSTPAPTPDTRTVLYVTNGTVNIDGASNFNSNNVRSIYMNTNSPTVELRDVNFSSNTNGAIWLAAGSLNVYKAKFNGNGNTNTGMKGGAILVEGTTAGTAGGALNLYAGGGDEAKDFKNNKAENGGAIYVVGNFTTIQEGSNALFESNQAEGKGGAIFQANEGATQGRVTLPSGARFYNNSAKTGGGAVYVSSAADASCTVNGSTFEENKTTGANSNGGAIYTNGRITLNSGTFDNNQAPNGWGGAVYSSKPKDSNYIVNVTGGTFTRNTAVQGGAIFAGESLANGGLVTVSGGTFGGEPTQGVLDPGNVATFTGKRGGGGAIWGDPVRITGTHAAPVRFTNNKATGGDGGAVFSSPAAAPSLSTNTSMQYAIFDGNSAAQGGGAVSMNCAATIDQVLFKSNSTTADAGGALQLNGAATIRNSSFLKNRAATQGGAIRLPLESDNTLVGITNSYFYENTATNDGGAIYNTGDRQTVTIHRSYFGNNSSVGTKGGAISISGGTFQLTQSTFVNNSIGQTGTLATGGAIYCNARSYRIANCTIYGNSSTGNGGGMYLDSSAGAGDQDSALIYCTITKNSANSYGGGLYTKASDITFGANIVIGNSTASSDPNTSGGRDTFREGSMRTRGYNVIDNHGAYRGGRPTGNVDWSGDDGITPPNIRTDSSIEIQSSSNTVEYLFGHVDAKPAENIQDLIDAGYSVRPPLAGANINDPEGLYHTSSYVTTMRLSNTNPARGLLPSNRSFYGNFFASGANPTAQDGYATHQDERGVLRGVYSTDTMPGSGEKIDVGAFQTIGPRSGGDDPNKITGIRMGGMTNSSMSPGMVVTLRAIAYKGNSFNESDIVENPKLAWTSSHPDYVNVDQYGNLTILAAPTVGFVDVTVSAVAVGNPAARSSITFQLQYRPTHTNIAKAIWSEWSGNIVPLSNANEFFGDLRQSAANGFASYYSNVYGVQPSVVTDLSNTAMGVALTPGTYNGSSATLRSSMHVSMSTLKEPGALVPMEYTYTFSSSEIDDLIANAATRGALSTIDVGKELFKTVNLSFTGEDGNTVVLVDSGVKGVSFTNALASRALNWQKIGDSYRLDLKAFIADAASAQNQVNFWNPDIVVADNSANGRIYGTVHLLDTAKRSSASPSPAPGGSGGGESGGGGGGGGCAAGTISAIALLALTKKIHRP